MWDGGNGGGGGDGGVVSRAKMTPLSFSSAIVRQRHLRSTPRNPSSPSHPPTTPRPQKTLALFTFIYFFVPFHNSNHALCVAPRDRYVTVVRYI